MQPEVLCRKTIVHGWDAERVLAGFGQWLSPALSVSCHLLSCRCQALTANGLTLTSCICAGMREKWYR